MKTSATVCALIAGAAVVGVAHHAAAPVSAVRQYASVAAPDVTLRIAQAPPRMTKDQALVVAKREYGLGVFSHPFTIQYGSFTDNSYRRTTAAGTRVTSQPVGNRDVWKLTLSGLNVPRPCGGLARTLPRYCPPPIHTFVIFIDDKEGRYLEAEGY